jgi:hypothetical protein
MEYLFDKFVKMMEKRRKVEGGRREESTLPKRTDIQTILIIGAGPIVIGRRASSTIPARRRARRCATRAIASCW